MMTFISTTLNSTAVIAGVTLACAAAFGAPSATQSAEQRGLEIAQEVDSRDAGFGDYQVIGKMTVRGPDGSTGNREFDMSTLELRDDGDKRLVVFSQPRDLTGFVSLTFSHGTAPDDQWIYLPALRRVKQLAARDKTGAFAGSEFSFEDIATWELDKYSYKFLRDEPCGEGKKKTCHVIEDVPNYAYSGYARLEEWIDPAIWHPVKIVYYDKASRPLKELLFDDYQQFENKYWRPSRLTMRNLQTGAVSVIDWFDYRFATGLRDADLSPSAIRRWSR